VAQHLIEMTVNGEPASAAVPSQMTLMECLRERLGLTGTKCGCAAGECGACTVILDGEAVNSCMVLAVECDGASVRTVEGLGTGGALDPLQAAMIASGGVQCGFCTPGVLMTARALLDRNPHPTDEQITEALVGNLCRCTGYLPILEAVRSAASAG
jgi:carbon-monoxide dehydrogenase small subunit